MILSGITKILEFIGALCVLLYGMDLLSNGIQKGAGKSLQALLKKITGNPVSSVLTGIAVTAIIQSSGATTVMVVSFVNAELLSLTQAIGIIFGANIGTTITAWIVSLFGFSFSIEAMAIPLFGLGFCIKFLKRFRIHNFADCFMGFALLFLGLGLLKTSMKLSPASVAFLQGFSSLGAAGLLLGVFIGAFFTALIHSSSAMTAIVLTMAVNGSITWELSAAIVMGSNIGSTVDAVMSSFGASTNAKRAAAVHVAFNVCGTLLALCVFHPFLKLIDLIVPGTPTENITTHIAMLHTVFNVSATLIFLPFIKYIAALAEKFITPSAKEEDSHYKLPAILPVSHISVDLYAIQIQKEIVRMASRVMEMLDDIEYAITRNSDEISELYNKITLDENYVDEMNDAITHFLQNCSRLPNANHNDRQSFAHMIQITQKLEDLSDECCSMSHTIQKYTARKSYNSDSNKIKKLLNYMEQVHIYYEQACTFISLGIRSEDKLAIFEIDEKFEGIKKELQKNSRKRIEEGGDVKAELDYTDLVRKIRKAGDCVSDIIQEISLTPEEASPSNPNADKILKAKNVTVNTKSHKVYSFNSEIPLAAKEYDLLVMLLQHKGEVVTRKQLLETVWKYEKETESRTIDVHVRLLRQKLGNDELIETVRGVGYLLT